jgi:hypothetical protein
MADLLGQDLANEIPAFGLKNRVHDLNPSDRVSRRAVGVGENPQPASRAYDRVVSDTDSLDAVLTGTENTSYDVYAVTDDVVAYLGVLNKGPAMGRHAVYRQADIRPQESVAGHHSVTDSVMRALTPNRETPVKQVIRHVGVVDAAVGTMGTEMNVDILVEHLVAKDRDILEGAPVTLRA